jgi:membrane-bound lytic murein transglycosylase D
MPQSLSHPQTTSRNNIRSHCLSILLMLMFHGFALTAHAAEQPPTTNSSTKKNVVTVQEFPSYSNNQILPYETGGGYAPLTETPTYLDSSSHFDTGQSNLDNTDNAQVNDDIWQRIKEGYAIPDAQSSLVKRHEKVFAAKPGMINNIVDRSQKYLFHIVEEVQSRGMPTEIALLPMIESAYNPNAYSSAKASGIWQFIPSTGKNFGLKQNWWVDNRRNITFATDAALSYLQKLHVMFGTWDLALAAYNAGEGTVMRAIQKNKRLGKPTDYQRLDLPKETRNYVPKLQAIKNIMTNPANYGLSIKPIENKAYFTTVTAPNQIDAKLVAELAQISYDEFIALNPGYNRPVIASKEDTQELLLPVNSVEKFHQNLATYDKPLVNWKPYKTKPGELLSTIATQHDIALDKLRKINQLPAQKKFTKPTMILVPNKAAPEKFALATPQTVVAVAPPANMEANIADTSAVAEQEVDIADLQNAGNIDDAHLDELQEIRHSEQESGVQKKPAVTHTVKKGETLSKIAQKYKVSTQSIAKLNHLKKNQVKTGQKLTIKAASTTKTSVKKSSKKSDKKASVKQKTSSKKTAKNNKTVKKSTKKPTKKSTPTKSQSKTSQK